MAAREAQLDKLLQLIAEHVDAAHCRGVDERYRAALRCQPVDHTPLVVVAAYTTQIALGEPWDEFEVYPYSQAFDDPVAMMQNMLLDRVVPGIVLKDDSPLSIRNDHGTVQIASLLGARWQMHEDNYPWVQPLRDTAQLEQFAHDGSAIDLEHGGIIERSNATLELYRSKLAQFSPCDELIQISMPDLQGPIDVAEQLRGSDLFMDFYEAPQLVEALLTRLTDTIINVAAHFREYSSDRLEPAATTQHGYVIPGRLLIRNDSAILVSASMYKQQIRPHDERLLNAMGTGSIHFCGNGEHLVDSMLRIEPLGGLDFGQAHMMDIPSVYARCCERGVAITNVQPAREDLVNGRAAEQFPTGAVLVYPATDIADARLVVDAFTRRTTTPAR